MSEHETTTGEGGFEAALRLVPLSLTINVAAAAARELWAKAHAAGRAEERERYEPLLQAASKCDHENGGLEAEIATAYGTAIGEAVGTPAPVVRWQDQRRPHDLA